MPASSEFDLIEKFFSASGSGKNGVVLGVGDDAALLEVPVGRELAVTVDTLVAGIHYPQSTAAADVGHKALSVNLSDLAAMGAEPVWATLALTLPSADKVWLRDFADGLFSLADVFGVQLVGGDTTRGPVATVTLQLHGLVPKGEALRRSGACKGDLVCVTGTLGNAALALRLMQEEKPVPEVLRQCLDRPTPRVMQGMALRGLASACIDISDGLLADLGHILEASGVGARLEVERLPLLDTYLDSLEPSEDRYRLAVSGGDDYELCFTVPPRKVKDLQRRFGRRGWHFTTIGVIEAEPGLRCLLSNGEEYFPPDRGYDHFARP